MPSGLQVWDANGRLILTTGDSITRVTGTVYVPRGQSGSAFIPANEGRPWFSVLSVGANGYTRMPKITISGNTISWSYEFSSEIYNDFFIIFGLY